MASNKQDDKPESMPFWHDSIKSMDNLVQNVRSSKAGDDKGGAGVDKPQVSSPSQGSGGIITIPVDKAAIKKLAEEIAGWKNPYDIAVWLFAEAETRLADAYVTVLDGTSPSVEVDTRKVVDEPSREAIESLAKAIYKRRPSLSEVHWFLAERRFLYMKAKAS